MEKLIEERPDRIDEHRPSGREFVLVSGLPRSGTSLMMQMLEAGGILPKTDGEREADVLRGLVEELLATEPLAQVEYVSCADAMTLEELQRIDGPALLSLAVVFGTTRLIDNVILGIED